MSSSALPEDRGDVPIWPILAMLPLLLICMVAMVAIGNGGASLSQLVVWFFGGLGFMIVVLAVGAAVMAIAERGQGASALSRRVADGSGSAGVAGCGAP